jgi:hypothetical protein
MSEEPEAVDDKYNLAWVVCEKYMAENAVS